MKLLGFSVWQIQPRSYSNRRFPWKRYGLTIVKNYSRVVSLMTFFIKYLSNRFRIRKNRFRKNQTQKHFYLSGLYFTEVELTGCSSALMNCLTVSFKISLLIDWRVPVVYPISSPPYELTTLLRLRCRVVAFF